MDVFLIRYPGLHIHTDIHLYIRYVCNIVKLNYIIFKTIHFILLLSNNIRCIIAVFERRKDRNESRALVILVERIGFIA
jgi:hypothetical protein